MRKTLGFLTMPRLISSLLLASLVSGCALPAHNNSLIFSVQRKIGLDITPTNGTNAGLTIGFTSNEFAHVPLWANGADGKPMAECQNPLQFQKTTTASTNTFKLTNSIVTQELPLPCAKKPKFQGQDAEGKGNGDDDDAYSVFASFGGDVGGGTKTGDVNANLKVASFFATGIAAQNLAERSDGKLLVGLDKEAKKESKNDLSTKSVYAFLKMTESKTDKIELACLEILQTEFEKLATTNVKFSAFANLSTKTASKLLVEIVKDESEVSVRRLNIAADSMHARYEKNLEVQKQLAIKDKDAYGKKVVSDEARNLTCTA